MEIITFFSSFTPFMFFILPFYLQCLTQYKAHVGVQQTLVKYMNKDYSRHSNVDISEACIELIIPEKKQKQKIWIQHKEKKLEESKSAPK